MKDKNRFAWGSSDITVTEEETANKSFSIYKTDDDKRLVFGWASVSITVDGEQLEDRQKDIIDPEDLEEAAYEYVLNFRDTGEEHISTMRKKGKLVESCVFTAEKQKAIGIPEGILPIGWWIGFKIEDDAAWERVKNGTYRMFSIEGKANRIPVEKGQLKGCGVLVVQDGKILSGTRIERGGRGKICGPGGHIEAGETPEEAAKREAMEEFGITCEELTSLGTLEDGTSAIFLCTKFSGTPETDEEEMTEPEWRTIEELREENLFGPFEQSLTMLNLSPAKRHSVAKTFDQILKFNPNHDALGRFASGGSGKAATSAGMKDYIAGLNPDVEYPERVEHWKKQIQAGNDRPILVSATDENRVIDGNHTLAAYKELGKTPKVYAMDRVEFLLGASEAKDTVEFIRQAIKDGKATEVKKGDRIAKTFDEILKLNPFHDALGRFATKNGFKTYSANPNTRAGAMAIARSAAAGHGKTLNVHPESYGETISQNADWLGQGNYNVGPGQTGNGILTQEVEPKSGMAGASAHGYVWQYYNRLDNRTTSQEHAKHSDLADHVKNVRLRDSDKLAMSPRDAYSRVVKGKIIAKNHDQARVAGKDISDSVDLSTSKSKKAAIDKMAKLQGWNKDPTVTEDLEVFQKATKQSGQLLVRTVHVDYATGKSAIDICKDTMGKGNAALGGGGGKAYGGGMYMVGTMVTGATGSKLKEKVAFAQNDSYGYGDTQMMATVHPSAKIATPNNAIQMKSDFLKMTSSTQEKYGNDYGAYIASKGFDGAQWHEGDNSYITMYNKSAMIFYAGVVAN